MGLESCDTFVVLAPSTLGNLVIFGKNSDRPRGEVQEIVHYPRLKHVTPSKLQCTYIAIDQVEETAAVILSKPSWMWGAEMGANSHGVTIGNEAVWTRLNLDTDDLVGRLLGMDLVRLGLERGKSATHALQVITTLLEEHGQGGNCSDNLTKPFTYHNSFLIVDSSEAWVLETAGRLWAAEHITSGARNISNSLSIGTKIDRACSGLKETAESLGYWNQANQFHFARVFGAGDESSRFQPGAQLLNQASAKQAFDVQAMMKILRDKESGICRGREHEFPSTSSQVSALCPAGVHLNCHWFTGTPGPKCSIFKPFWFSDHAFTTQATSPRFAKTLPQHQTVSVDRRHELYKAHERCQPAMQAHDSGLRNAMHQLEVTLIDKVDERSRRLQVAREKDTTESSDGDDTQMFNKALESELTLYASYS